MIEHITQWIEQGGYAAVAALMFAENLFPPIPSELIMPMAGYAAERGKLSLVGVLVAGWAGSIVGALFWYFVGDRFGSERLERFAARHGAWLTMKPEDVEQANRWFCRHGGKTVLLGRLVPAVRTFISVPAGVSDMRFRTFLIYSALGTAAWTTLLTAGGYLLGSQYDRIASWMGPVANLVLGLLVIAYLWRVVQFKRQQRAASS